MLAVSVQPMGLPPLVDQLGPHPFCSAVVLPAPDPNGLGQELRPALVLPALQVLPVMVKAFFVFSCMVVPSIIWKFDLTTSVCFTVCA